MSQLPDAWLRHALQPPRAGVRVLGRARLRAEPAHFRVDEILGFEPRGSGSHWLLKVRKEAANTEWVARALARQAGVRPHDVGYAGLKDRHAVAIQWFSVPALPRHTRPWEGMGGEGYEIVAAHRHDRKLRRGALQGNRFDVLLTDCTAAPDAELTSSTVEQHLQVLRLRGVPNYFGPQRFGRDAGNLLRARTWAESGDDPRADRSQRSFALSAARSLIFNTVLARRVRAETWDRLLPGDIANFDDGATVFAVAAVDEALQARASRGEIHPTGPLWGRGGSLAAGAAVDELEAQAAEECAPLPQWLLAEGLESQRRPLRLMPRDLQAQWQAQERQLRIGFTLGAGAFATTVLAELFAFDGPVAEA